MTGAFRERVYNSWVEVKENLGRSILQSLGVMLGVASVLGGFSISDSQRKRADELFIRLGGLDKLNVQPSAVINDGQPTALQTANLGLRRDDADEGGDLDRKIVSGVSQQKDVRARVRSPYADQERPITGIGGDYLPMDGYAIARGGPSPRTISTRPRRSRFSGRRRSRPSFPTARRSVRLCASATSPSRSSGSCRSACFGFASRNAISFAAVTASSRCRRHWWPDAFRVTSTSAWTG